MKIKTIILNILDIAFWGWILFNSLILTHNVSITSNISSYNKLVFISIYGITAITATLRITNYVKN